MIAEQLISNQIPPLKTSDTGLKALNWMDEFRISHLPIVNKEDFLGLISEEDIYNMNAPEEPIGNHSLSLARPYVKHHNHIFDAIRLISELHLSVLPVLDEKQKYLGLITIPDLIRELAELSAIKDPGGIVVLELNERDYMLSQIAHIIEGNDCKILSVYVKSIPDSTKIEVTLKLNRNELQRVLAAFARYNYEVKASYMEGIADDTLNDRYQLLMNYLNL